MPYCFCVRVSTRLSFKTVSFRQPDSRQLIVFLENSLAIIVIMSLGNIFAISVELKYHLILVLKTRGVQISSQLKFA